MPILLASVRASWRAAMRWSVIFLGLGLGLSARAQTLYYFDVNGTTAGAGTANAGIYSWGTNSVWANNNNSGTASTVAWTNGTNVAVFAAGTDNGTASYTVNMNAAATVGGIRLDRANVTINSSTASTLTFGNATPFITVNNSTSTLTISAAISLANNTTARTLTINGSGNTAISSIISDGSAVSSIVKSDAGRLTLSGVNTFTGGINVTGGTLRATTSAQALGTGASTLTLAGGNLELANGSALNFARNTSVLADAVITNARTSAGAGITHTLGTLSIGANTLSITGTANTTSGNAGVTFGATTLTGNANFNVAASTLLTLGALNDGGTPDVFTKSGAGTLTLATAATSMVNGSGVNVTGGNLNVNIAGALGTLANVTVSGANLNLGAAQTFGALNGDSTGTVNLGALALTVGSTNNLNGNFAGNITSTTTAGTLTKSGTGTQTLSGTSSYTGTTTISQGTLQINADAPSGANGALGNATSAVTVNNGSTGTSNTALVIGATGITIGRAVTVANSGTGTTTLGGSITSGTGTFSGAVVLNKGANFEALGNSVISFTGTISGASALTKTDVGTVELTNASNAWTGATIINAGALRISGSAAALSGGFTSGATGRNLQLNGGVLEIGVGTTFARQLGTGNSQVQWTGSGGFSAFGANRTVTLANSTGTANGLLTWNAGSFVTTGNALVLGSATSDSNLIFTNPIDLAGAVREIRVLGGTGAVDGQLDGILSTTSAGGGLLKTGDGNLALNAANTYNGTTTVSAGSIQANVNSLSGTAGAFGNAATAVVLNDASTGTSNTGLYVGATGVEIGRAVTVTNNGTGTSSLGGTITSGTGTFSGTITLDKATTLVADGTSSITFNGAIGGAGNITKSGTGNVTLSGTNTFTGNVTVTGGVLVAASTSALGGAAAGTAVTSGGTLALSGGITIASESISLAGNGTGSLGALHSLAGSNVLGTNIALTDHAGVTAASGAALTLKGVTGSGFNLTVGGAGNVTINNTIATGSGALIKDGAGTLTLTSNNTFTGNVSVNAGTLNINKLNALGTGTGNITIGTGGTLQVQGGLSFANRPTQLGGTLESVSGVNTWGSKNLTLTSNATITSSTVGQLFTVGAYGNANLTTILTPSGILDLGANTLTVNGTGNISLDSNIIGTGGLYKDGTGTATLHGDANSYTGTTTVNKGTLILDTLDYAATDLLSLAAQDNAIKGSLIIGNNSDAANSAIVRYGNSTSANNKISDTSAITIYGSGQLNLNNRDDTVGAITIQGGNITTGSGVLTLNGDVTSLASSQTGTFNGVLSLGSASRTFTVADGTAASDLTINANINFGAIVKEGAGTMTITSNNTVGYSGTTTINQGVLNIQNSSALGQVASGSSAAGTFVTATGAALELQGGIAVGNEYLSLKGTGVSDGGALRSIVGDNSWSGPIAIEAAARINTSSTTINNTTVASTLTLSGNITGNNTLTFGGDGTTFVTGNIGTLGQSPIIKDGTGTLVLSGNNSYNGPTDIQQGVVNIRSNNALGFVNATTTNTTVASGAALQMQNNITVSNENLILNGTGVSSDGALRSLSGNNTWSGNVTVNSSSARISSDTALQTLTIGGTVAIGGNTLVVGGVGNTTISGPLTSSGTAGYGTAPTGTLSKVDSGTLRLSGASPSFLGDVSVTGGTLAFGANNVLNSSVIDMNVGGSGTVSLNDFAQSIGTLAGTGAVLFGTSTSSSTLTLASSSTFSGSFGGTGTLIIGPGVTLTLGSSINAPNVNIILQGGTIDFGGYSQTFGTLTVTGNSTLNFSGNSTFSIENLFIDSGKTVQITNWVNDSDFFLSRSNPGTRNNPPLNQVTFGPSSVPGGTVWDYTNTTYQTWDKQITPVPEPSTYGAMLMGAGLAVFGLKRWRQRKVASKK